MLPRSTPKPKQIPELKLLKASLEEEEIKEEGVSDLNTSDDSKTLITKVKSSIEKTNSAGLFVKVNNKPKLLSAAEKAKTTEPEVKKELKRGSMKDKWGLGLTYVIVGAKISLSGIGFKVVFIKHYVRFTLP